MYKVYLEKIAVLNAFNIKEEKLIINFLISQFKTPGKEQQINPKE